MTYKTKEKKNYGDEQPEKLHKDLSHHGSFWVVWDIDLQKAISQRYRLSALDICIFQDIAMYYDSHKQNPRPASYSDFANWYSYTQTSVRDTIKQLIRWELIFVIKVGKGRGKSEYSPNVKYLHKLLIDYLKIKN